MVQREGKNWQPGPGAYSPTASTATLNEAVTRDEIFKFNANLQLNDKSKQKTIGKNAPIKNDILGKKKTVPSIPSKSLAPPEDKLATLNQETSQNKLLKPKVPSYMTELEGSRNPVVGPFSYSPKQAQKNIVDQVPWEKMAARFKDSPD